MPVRLESRAIHLFPSQEARLSSLEQRGDRPGDGSSNNNNNNLAVSFPGLLHAMGVPHSNGTAAAHVVASGVTTLPPPVPTFVNNGGGLMPALRRPSAGSGLTAVDSLGFSMLTSTALDFDFNTDEGTDGAAALLSPPPLGSIGQVITSQRSLRATSRSGAPAPSGRGLSVKRVASDLFLGEEGGVSTPLAVAGGSNKRQATGAGQEVKVEQADAVQSLFSLGVQLS